MLRTNEAVGFVFQYTKDSHKHRVSGEVINVKEIQDSNTGNSASKRKLYPAQ